MEPEMENLEASASIALPKWIAWEIAGRCNLRCIHCRSASDDEGNAAEYSAQEAKGLIDEVAGYASPVLALSGGEPLLENLRDFDKYAGKCGACEYVRVCGGCTARAAALSEGDYLAEEPFCAYVPTRPINEERIRQGKQGKFYKEPENP
jgi:MoaA/NifB/PqqE/SkfB family radical SAM enzyme